MPSTYEYVSPGFINVKDATGATTQLRFTSTGQLQSIQDPQNRTTQFAYDTGGNLSRITAPSSQVYQYAYDAQGRLTSQTDPANQTLNFTYGANSNAPTTVRDAKGQVTQYAYNAYGELTGITYLDGKAETYTYDLSGRLTRLKERSGDTFTYTYDSAGRITRKDLGDGTFEQFTYDSVGRVATVRDVRGGTTTLTYDTNNRLTKIAYPGSRFLSFTYDAVGRRTQMVDQAGFTVNYSYDAQGRLAELKNASGARIVAYTYDANSRLARETNGNGTYTTYTYDTAGQVTAINNYAPNGTVNSFFQYTYNNLGQQTSVNTSNGRWTYTYDAAGQLTRAQLASTNASITNQDLQYVYDTAGNRIRTVINGVTTNYAANTLNQYTTVGSAVQTYDTDGNLIKVVNGSQTTTYTYNKRNQLIGATTPEGTFTYEYDAFGNRTASTKNGVKTDFLVDPFGLGDVVGEYSGSTATNYVHGIGLVGRVAGTNTAYYDSDLLGSTTGLTNTTGSYINRYAYRPYGESLLSTEGIANSFEYVGQWGLISESNGLNFVRARYYTSTNGRFTTTDPIGQQGGLNLYQYAINNPVNLIDVDGYVPVLPVIAIGARFAYTGYQAYRSQALYGAWRAAATPVNRALFANSSVVGRELGVGGFQKVAWNAGTNNPLSYVPPHVLETLRKAGIGGLAGIGLLGGTGGASAAGRDNPPTSPTDPPPGNPPSAPTSSDPPIPPGVPSSPSEPPGPSGPGSGASGGMGNGSNSICPLVLDLDGDGIELTSLSNSRTFFDLDADGFAEQTGWVKADDGLLAIDKNGNRRIDDINELFGTATTDGFVALKQLDSNNDNLIDSRDSQFSKLLIWRDYNQDGYSNIGELRTLTAWGIRSINLTSQTVSQFNQGNRISSISSYTTASGTTRQIADVWFALDQTNTIYDKEYQLKAETLFLPSLRGNGELANLYIAMSNDPTLLGLMRNFVALTPSNNWDNFSRQVVSQVETILYRWAGVENAGPRGSMNGKALGFMEKYTGQPFFQRNVGSNPAGNAVIILNRTWDRLFQQLLGRLVVQGPMRQLFPNVIFNHNQDRLISSGTLDSILTQLQANRPTDFDAALRYWNLAVLGLDALEDRFGLSQTEYDARINQTLATANNFGTYLSLLRKPDFLTTIAAPVNGTAGNDNFIGSTGNDTYNGGRGNDTINGGAGDDTLDGSFGNDTVKGGDGNDYIRGGLDVDSLDGGNGIDTLELELSTASNLTINNPRSGINLPGIITATNFENFKITTGSGNDSLIQSGLVGGVVFRGSETFNGGAGNDTLNAGLGQQDQVDGGAGTDLLILDYSIGDTGNGMSLEISSVTSEGATGSAGRLAMDNSWLDSIVFSGIDRFQITGTQKDDTIEVTGQGTVSAGAGNDTITIQSSGFTTIDGGAGKDLLSLDFAQQKVNLNLTFTANGITGFSTFSNIEEIADIIGGSSDDILNATAITNNLPIQGNAGNDTLTSGSGQDYLLGGDGNDVLRAGAGNDSGEIVYYPGYYRVYTSGLYGGAGTDQLFGEDGDDWLFEIDGKDLVDGGTGNDVVFYQLQNLTTPITITYTNTAGGTTSNGGILRNIEQFDIQGTAGNDAINIAAASLNSYLAGNAGNDTLISGSGQDYLLGGDGNDVLRAGAGNDSGEIVYYPGYYRVYTSGLYGGAGTDQLFGEDGDDWLFEIDGKDLVDGGTGNDVVFYQLQSLAVPVTITYTNTAGGTTSNGGILRNIEQFDIQGTAGNDAINIAAASLNSYLAGNAGNDTLISGSGQDYLLGGDGDDVLRGGAGNDSGEIVYYPGYYRVYTAGLYGGAGTDQLFGEDGDDWLTGGTSNDTLTGGTGRDRFIFDINTAFNSTIGVDKITDFVSGTDKIVLDKTTFTTLTSPAESALNASEFAVINDTVNGAALAGSNAARVVFNRATGDLFYNADGLTAGLGSGGRFATIAGATTLSASDFLLQT